MKQEAVMLIFISWIPLCLYGSPSIVAATVDENTVALWLFDEGSGDVAKDSSGNGNDGKVIEAEWVPGKFGTALDFDGIGRKDDYVEVPGSDSLELVEELTIEAWVYIRKHQDDNIRIVRAYDAAVSAGYSLLLAKSGQVSAFLSVGGWKQFKGQVIPEREWIHLAVTYDSDAGEVKLYVNGEIDFQGVLAGELTPRGMDPVLIGRAKEGDPETPDGMIDEIRISNVARTQEEIREAMKGLAVEPLDKLATTWGSRKNEY